MTGSPDSYAARDFLVGRAKGGSPDAAPTPVRTLGADTPPKVAHGDQVRVVLEGRASDVGSRGTFAVGVMGSRNHIEPSQAHVVSVEVLTPPTPTYWPPTAGDVWQAGVETYLFGRHGTFRGVWNDDGTLTPATMLEWATKGPPRVLRLLVRAGKAVQS